MVEPCERSSRQAPEPAGGWLCQRAGGPRRRSGPLPVSARATAGPLAAIPALAPPSATYGNSASSRARLTARATWL